MQLAWRNYDHNKECNLIATYIAIDLYSCLILQNNVMSLDSSIATIDWAESDLQHTAKGDESLILAETAHPQSSLLTLLNC